MLLPQPGAILLSKLAQTRVSYWIIVGFCAGWHTALVIALASSDLSSGLSCFMRKHDLGCFLFVISFELCSSALTATRCFRLLQLSNDIFVII